MKYRTFTLEGLVHFADVDQRWLSFECGCTVLYQLEDALLHFTVGNGLLHERDKVVHKLPGCNLGEEVVATVLYADIQELYRGCGTSGKV